MATYFIGEDYNLGENSTIAVARNAAGQEEEPNPADEEEAREDEEEWERQQREQDEEVTELLDNVQNLATVALFQKATFTAVGCSLFRNGTVIYIDPKMPGVSQATLENSNVMDALSIGGYYLIIESSGVIKDGQYEVEIVAKQRDIRG